MLCLGALWLLDKAASLPGLRPWHPGLLAQMQDTFWLPPQASSSSKIVDDLFNILMGVSIFFFALIIILMTIFVILFRRREGVAPSPSPSHNTKLELFWMVVPLLIVGFIFYHGVIGFMDLRVAPRYAYEIRVVGRQWIWIFEYPNGHKDEQLHVPVDQPVRLVMRSDDVVHGFYVPDFRVQMDVVPGRYTTVWFHAKEPGEHGLYCAQYCGTNHSDMVSKVIVHPPGEFEKWLAEAGNQFKNLPPAEAGQQLYTRRGCGQCHSVDGTAGTGPSFKGIFGHPAFFEGGGSAPVDENYIRQSIVEPEARVVQGYKPVMPTYKGILSDEEITYLIEYIKTLK
jgi:cytochrome c oxidase subunit 2